MINSKQFYLTKEAQNVFHDWNCHPLKNGYHFYYQPELNIIYSSDRILLVGFAWQVNPKASSPQKQLEALEQNGALTQTNIFEIEKSWCGRYILIADNWIFLDTIGSLGIFYSDKTISSSLNVLCQIERRSLIYPKIKHGDMPDFVPGIYTQYQGIYRLLPSQILNLDNMKWELRPLLIDTIPQYNTLEEGINTFSKYFEHSIHNLTKTFPEHRLWIATTGGRDSRAAMALLEKSGTEYQTFTLWHTHISKADQSIPSKLSKVLHKKHRFIKRKASDFSQGRKDDYQRHTSGMAVDEDWNFYAYGQYQQLQEDGHPIVLLRSSLWEIACEYYKMVMGERSNDITNIFPGMTSNAYFRHSIEEWQSIVLQDKLNSQISIQTRTFWDLREGCWLSSIEQSFDMMTGIVSIQPLNCRLFISLLMGFNLQDRIDKSYEEKLTNTLCPAFAEILYDYQYETYAQKWVKLKKKLKRFLRKLLDNFTL